MRDVTKGLLGAVGVSLALWIGWGAYVVRTTERVPYERLGDLDGVELRRYPQAVLVETTAPDERAAFRRLFRYISGANEENEKVTMTAPVATRGGTVATAAPVRTARSVGESVSMTAPVRTDRSGSGVTMAFYLPTEYEPGTAPVPTDPSVSLTVEPPRTVAVRRFSWYATENRVRREERRLLHTLDGLEVEVSGLPALLRYDDPWTPPFMRRNEVGVPVETPEGPLAP